MSTVDNRADAPAGLRNLANEWFSSNRRHSYAHRIIGSPGGKHCKSLQRNVWRGAVSPFKSSVFGQRMPHFAVILWEAEVTNVGAVIVSFCGINAMKSGRSIFFPIPPGGWADSYHLTFLSEPFDLFVGPFENGFLLAVIWGYSSIGGGRNKNGTSHLSINTPSCERSTVKFTEWSRNI